MEKKNLKASSTGGIRPKIKKLLSAKNVAVIEIKKSIEKILKNINDGVLSNAIGFVHGGKTINKH